MLQSVGDIKDNIASLQKASKGEPEKLAHEATKMANFFPILISASVGAASRTQSQQMQSSLLEETKTLAEACMQMAVFVEEVGAVHSGCIHQRIGPWLQIHAGKLPFSEVFRIVGQEISG